MSYIETQDGTRLYYKDWGKGRPVVLLHGWPLSASSFDDLAMAIANAGFRAIAYDRRGFGRSSQPWSGYDYNTLSDDLAAVIAATDSHDATLLGFSMGGGEVARYMSRHDGKNIAQTILVSSILPYMLKTDDNPEGTDKETFEAMTAEINKDRAKFWTTFFKQFYGVGIVSHPVSDELVEWSRDVAMEASLKATLDCAAAFATTDFRLDLPAFKVPTLIIHGTKDKTVPIDGGGRATARGIAGSKLLEYDGAPHGLLATHKDKVIEDVLNFLQSHRTSAVFSAVAESA